MRSRPENWVDRNWVAAPGNPPLPPPLFLPLVTVPQVRTGLWKGARWLLRWPSITELLMICQVVPLLLPPFPQLLNNVLEEGLSWLYGKYGDSDGQCPDLFRDPFKFALFIPVIVKRVGRSCSLFLQWYRFLLNPVPKPMVNRNHALINFLQGTDFSLLAGFDVEALVRDPWLTKQKTQLMALCSRLAYERWHIARTIVDESWGGFTFECAWHFDQISLIPEPGKPRETAYVKTSAMLLTAPGGVAVLAFRGTEPLENVGWLTDFDVVPPEQDPVGWPYGKYHSGFRRALGLGHHLQGDPSVQCGFLIQEGDVLIRKPPENRSPFDIITAKIEELLSGGGRLFVTGHSLGGAVANLYVAAATIPPGDSSLSSNIECGLFTYGQPRVGNNQYARNVMRGLQHQAISDESVRYVRVVNTNDIVPRDPPPLDLFYQHSGQLVFLEPAPTKPPRANPLPINPAAASGSIVFLQEQPIIFRAWAITQGTQKALYAWEDYKNRLPGSSAVNVTLTWLAVYTTLIPLLFIGPVLLMVDPLTCAVLAAIGVGLLGLPVGLLDHSLTGYEAAISNSVDGDWIEQ
ncbi:hypothetical protein KFL_000710340 [Klebsormidium nitens]|uniref:Fungal lipase-type domain-containing protein n=1 Tax=Klebsormidium nitens TaxID=105231 RepID=A0A1Y1HVA2_KLENI|nr:hypothetical protein KFL_000710340 [Klebsormidium nitens]|eukprot:GAQ81129.1 hypothetical protein KFL_000710340 [Klebsormidium nitens]